MDAAQPLNGVARNAGLPQHIVDMSLLVLLLLLPANVVFGLPVQLHVQSSLQLLLLFAQVLQLLLFLLMLGNELFMLHHVHRKQSFGTRNIVN